MKVQLCNHLGVFNPGDEYEAGDEQCLSLIAEGYAFKQGQISIETAEKPPVGEVAMKPSAKPKGRPKGSKTKRRKKQ